MYKFILDFLTAAFVLITVITAIVYFPRLKAWFASFRPQNRVASEEQHRLALIVPARNESKVIGDLFESIAKQSYPKDKFDTFVIVKDENDPTIDMTVAAGGIPVVVKNQGCKGDALDGCLKSILRNRPNDFDAYIIVDADCMLDESFLSEMNNAMASDRQIILGKKLVKNYLFSKKCNSLASECNGLIWSIIDDMGNRYKSDHNITCMTIGTGILLRSDVISELGGWPYRETLTEDIELMYDCVLRDFSTYYYSYAKLYVEESTSLKVTNKRRTRWLTGVVDSKRIYGRRLRKKCHQTNDYKNYFFTTALSPVFFFIGQLLMCFSMSLFIAIVLFIHGNQLASYAFNLSLVSFGTIYLSFFLLTLMCLIVDWNNIKVSVARKLLLLFVHPFFYMGYIPIISSALIFTNNKGWEVIDRVDFVSESEAVV